MSFADICLGLKNRPKLLVHVFIGSRMAKLAEEGDTMSAGDKAVNYAGMVVGGVIGASVGWYIYRRTMARAAELEAETLAAGAGGEQGGDGGRRTMTGDGGFEDAQEGSSLMRDSGAAGADDGPLMDEDDISLWDNEDSGYRDTWDEEQGVEGNGKK